MQRMPPSEELKKATLRFAHPADEPWLFALFAEEKSLEFAVAGLDQFQLRPLLEMQYRARCSGYRSSFPNATQWVIEDGAARPVGQLLRNDDPQVIRIVDLCIARSVRCCGLATHLLRALQHEAAHAGKRIELQVTTGSAAKRLYLRLGFATQSANGMTEQMAWNRTESRAESSPESSTAESKSNAAQPHPGPA
jgi:ribosomal protein S18 acetylase RimI-like enzyme